MRINQQVNKQMIGENALYCVKREMFSVHKQKCLTCQMIIVSCQIWARIESNALLGVVERTSLIFSSYVIQELAIDRCGADTLVTDC